MSKKTKAKARPLRADDAKKKTKKPIVEVTVSPRCECACFRISVGSTAVWRIAGLEPSIYKPDLGHLFHVCDDDDWCDEYHWE